MDAFIHLTILKSNKVYPIIMKLSKAEQFLQRQVIEYAASVILSAVKNLKQFF